MLTAQLRIYTIQLVDEWHKMDDTPVEFLMRKVESLHSSRDLIEKTKQTKEEEEKENGRIVINAYTDDRHGRYDWKQNEKWKIDYRAFVVVSHLCISINDHLCRCLVLSTSLPQWFITFFPSTCLMVSTLKLMKMNAINWYEIVSAWHSKCTKNALQTLSRCFSEDLILPAIIISHFIRRQINDNELINKKTNANFTHAKKV